MPPDGDTTNAFLYCLGYAASRARVGVIFFTACSNHYHAGIIDHEGRLPEFLECFHKLFAKHQNARFGRWENFWAAEQTSVVELVRPEDILAKAAYAVSNPVGGTATPEHLRGGHPDRRTFHIGNHRLQPDEQPGRSLPKRRPLPCDAPVMGRSPGRLARKDVPVELEWTDFDADHRSIAFEGSYTWRHRN